MAYDMVSATLLRDRVALEQLVTNPLLDFEELWLFLTRHRIRDFVGSTLLRQELGSALPRFFLRRLEKHLHRSTEKREHLHAMMREVAASLDVGGIRYLVLKGLVLAERYYESHAERYQNDLDILISPEQLPGTLEILKRLGFARKRSGRGVRRGRLATQHAISLRRDTMELDLHWRTRMAPAYRIDYKRVWHCAESARIREVTYPAVAASDELANLFLSVVHDTGRGALRLKHLIDSYKIVESLPLSFCWDPFWQQRRGEGTLDPAANGCALLIALLPSSAATRRMADSLSSSGGRLRIESIEEARHLARQSKGSLDSALWFLRVYPRWTVRDAAWYLQRQVPHVGRVPQFFGRSLRLLIRLPGWSAHRLARRFHKQKLATLPPRSGQLGR